MRTHRKKIVLFVLAGLFTVGATVALAGGGHGKHMKQFVEWKISSVMDDLEATPKQRAVVEQVKTGLFKQGEQLKSGHLEVHDAFMAEWAKDAPDVKRVHQMIDDRVDEWRAMAHQAVDGAADIHTTLTPSQRAKVAKMIQDHRH